MKKVVLILAIIMFWVPAGVLAQDGPVPEPTGTIAIGEAVQGTITDENYEVFYAFSAEAGEMIYAGAVELGNLYLSLELTLLDSAGQIVLEEERWLPLVVLGPYEVPASGEYMIHLQRIGGKDGTSTGNFMLALDTVELAALESGTPASGTLRGPGSVHFWTYQGTQGEVISIEARGNGLEFAMVKPGSWYVTDKGPAVDPEDNFSLLDQDGEYYVMLQTEHLDGTDYELLVTSQAPAELMVGEGVGGVLSPAEIADYYATYASMDKLLRIEVASDDADFSGEIHIYNDRGGYEGFAYNSAEDAFDLLVEPWIVPEEGTYYVLVTPTKANASDVPYNITVRESELILLGLDEAVTGVLDENVMIQGYAVRGTAEQQVSVTMTQLDGNCTPKLSVRNRDERGFVALRNVWSHALSVEIVFPQDDFYVFTVEQGAYGDECRFEFVVQVIE